MEIVVKTTLIIPEQLWNQFSAVVALTEGRQKKNEVLVRLVKEYVQKQMPSLKEAVQKMK